MIKQILVIDDDAAVRLTVQTILTRSGYEVTCARDGEEGVDTFRALRPDLVITDVIMPNREGIETILAIRHEQPNAKIVAMSGGGRIGSADLLMMARDLGADHIISKPFDIDVLTAIVRQSLSE
jgi:DNA-binding response OmpR family regulator